jgi:hypothetical protein
MTIPQKYPMNLFDDPHISPGEVAEPLLQHATPNPDTHCTSCGEVLSIYSHCWKCHWPPMDPKQDAITQTTTVTTATI